MLECLAALPALLIFLGLIALLAILWQRQQRQRRDAYAELAQRLGYAYHSDNASLAPIEGTLSAFEFWRGSRTVRVAAAAAGRRKEADVTVLLLTATMTGVDQSTTNYFSAILLRDPRLDLPDFYLRPRQSGLAAAINEALSVPENGLPFTIYPALTERYTLTGGDETAVTNLFAGPAGQHLATLATQNQLRRLECRQNTLLYSRFESKKPDVNILDQLLAEALSLLETLADAGQIAA